MGTCRNVAGREIKRFSSRGEAGWEELQLQGKPGRLHFPGVT